MLARQIPYLLLLALILALPFALRPRENILSHADDTLVIVTPHSEAIRYEFSLAFARYYKEKTGRTVAIDWRTPGGTSEIAKYLESEYAAAFRNEYSRRLGHSWTSEVERSFANPRVKLPPDPSHDDLGQAARRAFLASDVSIGIDLFFGGGSYDFQKQADAGRLVDSGLVQNHPEWFNENVIPRELGGEVYYDREGRWIGTCLSAFGIASNIDTLRRLGVGEPPAQWADLADQRLMGQVAMADPTKSGSITKAFEMLIQEQMLKLNDPATGWDEGIRVLLKISANARYFTDAASRIVTDVALGDAAAGMCIDFYGRQQSEAVAKKDQTSRMVYLSPRGGTSIGVDPIGLLRGAPHREVAIAFMEFVLSPEGQRLWNFRPGTPGGPVRFALRRLPIQPELYASEFRQFRSDPDVLPYEDAKSFTYHADWTGPFFQTLRFIVKAAFIDPHPELRKAWRALVDANFPSEASKLFFSLEGIDFASASGPIRQALASGDPVTEVTLSRRITVEARERYQRVENLARQGR